MIANLQEQSCYMIANPLSAYEWDVESDKELIEALIEHTGKSASDIARTAGLAVTTITRPLNKPVKHQLSKPTLTKLRETFPDFPAWAENAIAMPDQVDEGEYLPVDVLPSYAGMGGGGTGEGDLAKALISRRMIEDELRAKPSDLLLIEARGESMQPDFMHGDQILIDKRDCNPVQPGAFALWDGDGYVVKLVERIPREQGRYRIFSANGRFSSYDVDAEEIRIMGRPVWFGRRL